MKLKVLSFLMAAATCLALQGAGYAQQADPGKSSAALSAGQKTYLMRIAHVTSPKGIRNLTLEKFAAGAMQKSKGTLKVQIYPGAQLGNNQQTLEGMQLGTIESSVIPTAFLGGFEPLMSVLDLPYLFPNTKTMFNVLQSGVAGEILALPEKKGVKGLAFWPEGLKQITTNFPVTGPESFKGRKIRITQSEALVAQYRALGASPIPMEIPELYNALQQGMVDGQENPLGTMYDFKFYEVQPFLNMTSSGALVDVFFVSKKWFDTLPADLQKLIESEAKTFGLTRLDAENARNVTILDELKTKGKIKITEFTPRQIDGFVKVTAAAHDAFLSKYPDAKSYYDKLRTEIK